jgi:undecaprenyl diphosphate synthase
MRGPTCLDPHTVKPMPPQSATPPRHIAIVMDGNGRWAKARHRPRSFGHNAGRKAVREVVEGCLRQGVQTLTLFAFSSENWQRPQEEVGALMALFMRALDKEVDELHEQGVRLRFVGDLGAFDTPLHKRMIAAMTHTASNDQLHLNIAVNYGGRWDIVQAARKVAESVVRGELRIEDIHEQQLDQGMCLAELPPLDLFIRTGGESRVSNFLLWQLAYAELYFTETLWPDFDQASLQHAIEDYARRERRYGRVSEQVNQTRSTPG